MTPVKPDKQRQLEATADGAKDGDVERDPELLRAEAEIARTRARVAGSLVALRREMARRVDWREWVRLHPLSFVAGAFLLGALLGSRQQRRRDSWR
jgi:hypothetical protein